MPRDSMSVDLRPLLPPARDQGLRDTCLAFAVTAAHELVRARDAETILELSEEFLHWGTRQLCGDVRTTLDGVARALQRWGQPDRAVWPYQAGAREEGLAYTPPKRAFAVCSKASVVRVRADASGIADRLRNGQPVVLSVRLSEPFYRPAAGRVAIPSASEMIDAQHAVLAAGLGVDQHGCADSFIVRNSWGDGWGDAGYGYIPFEYIARYAIEAAVVEV